jgi:hypothetical protein
VRRRWRRDLQVRAHLIEFALADAFDRQQIFDAPEWAALIAEIHDGLGSFGADARDLLQFLNIRDVQIQRMRRRRLFLRSYRECIDEKKIAIIAARFTALAARARSRHRGWVACRTFVAKPTCA